MGRVRTSLEKLAQRLSDRALVLVANRLVSPSTPTVIAMTVIADEDSAGVRIREIVPSTQVDHVLEAVRLYKELSEVERAFANLTRCACSNAARSSEWTMKTRTPVFFDVTS
jgi:hypothetical protein